MQERLDGLVEAAILQLSCEDHDALLHIWFCINSIVQYKNLDLNSKGTLFLIHIKFGEHYSKSSSNISSQMREKH